MIRDFHFKSHFGGFCDCPSAQTSKIISLYHSRLVTVLIDRK